MSFFIVFNTNASLYCLPPWVISLLFPLSLVSLSLPLSRASFLSFSLGPCLFPLLLSFILDLHAYALLSSLCWACQVEVVLVVLRPELPGASSRAAPAVLTCEASKGPRPSLSSRTGRGCWGGASACMVWCVSHSTTCRDQCHVFLCCCCAIFEKHCYHISIKAAFKVSQLGKCAAKDSVSRCLGTCWDDVFCVSCLQTSGPFFYDWAVSCKHVCQSLTRVCLHLGCCLWGLRANLFKWCHRCFLDIKDDTDTVCIVSVYARNVVIISYVRIISVVTKLPKENRFV